LNTTANKADAQLDGIRKPYTKPVLQIYGGVLELTQAHSTTGSADGANATTQGSVTKTA